MIIITFLLTLYTQQAQTVSKIIANAGLQIVDITYQNKISSSRGFETVEDMRIVMCFKMIFSNEFKKNE